MHQDVADLEAIEPIIRIDLKIIGILGEEAFGVGGGGEAGVIVLFKGA